MLNWPENDGDGLYENQCIGRTNPTSSLGNKSWTTLDCMAAAHFKLAYSFTALRYLGSHSLLILYWFFILWMENEHGATPGPEKWRRKQKLPSCPLHSSSLNLAKSLWEDKLWTTRHFVLLYSLNSLCFCLVFYLRAALSIDRTDVILSTLGPLEYFIQYKAILLHRWYFDPYCVNEMCESYSMI